MSVRNGVVHVCLRSLFLLVLAKLAAANASSEFLQSVTVAALMSECFTCVLRVSDAQFGTEHSNSHRQHENDDDYTMIAIVNEKNPINLNHDSFIFIPRLISNESHRTNKLSVRFPLYLFHIAHYK